jgi:N-acetylglutamate synthase-like GNAT family acetyltransferase
MPDDRDITIVAYEDRHAGDFKRLNREWLDGFGLYEDADAKQLDAPREAIIATGGEIYVALKGGRVVGTCALVRMSTDMFEVAKLSVAADARGDGLGRRLTQHAFDRARALGATRVALVSSTKLTTALGLYARMGFVQMPLPDHLPYATADVYMELELGITDVGSARAD